MKLHNKELDFYLCITEINKRYGNRIYKNNINHWNIDGCLEKDINKKIQFLYNFELISILGHIFIIYIYGYVLE